MVHPIALRSRWVRLATSCAVTVLGLLALAPLVSGCERRVAEPEARSSAPTAPATSSAPSDPALQGRCIKPTPETPARMAPAAGPDPRCPADPTGRPELAWGPISFADGKTTLKAEIAREDEHRQRGLMYRTSMPEGEGMLFVFQQRRVLTFWMHNTCIPLDMLFIDHDGVIVGIEENIPTMNDDTYHVGCPSLYVLEVNAGWARRHGVRAGQRVTLPKLASAG
jgi:uncharacterized membrane protein (UPF0127 family)